jgi:hypothetical protein
MSHARSNEPQSAWAASAAPTPDQRERNVSPWTSALIGVLAGLLGLAPWLVTGAQLQLQNLWATEVLPAQMPASLLPLSQYELTTLVALITVGGAVAGFTVRLCRPERRRAATWSAAAGVLAVQGAATIQAFSIVRAGWCEDPHQTFTSPACWPAWLPPSLPAWWPSSSSRRGPRRAWRLAWD